jgi:hypothetical protein
VVATAPGERNTVKGKKTEPLAQLNIKIAPALRRAIEKAALAELDIELRAEGSRCVRAQSRVLAAAPGQLIPTAKLPTTRSAPVFQNPL